MTSEIFRRAIASHFLCACMSDDAFIARWREVFASLMQEIGPIQYEFAL